MEKTIEELAKERDELYDKINNINEQIRQIRISEIHLDIEGKYIKYKDIFGYEHYCYVTDVMFNKLAAEYRNTKYSYLIRGHGFCGEFTGYGDSTSFQWSYWYEFHIESTDIDDLKRQVDNVQIITKEEFDEQFNLCLENIKEYKESYIYEKKE